MLLDLVRNGGGAHETRVHCTSHEGDKALTSRILLKGASQHYSKDYLLQFSCEVLNCMYIQSNLSL